MLTALPLTGQGAKSRRKISAIYLENLPRIDLGSDIFFLCFTFFLVRYLRSQTDSLLVDPLKDQQRQVKSWPDVAV